MSACPATRNTLVKCIRQLMEWVISYIITSKVWKLIKQIIDNNTEMATFWLNTFEGNIYDPQC